jgi:hypothetical protein
MPENEIMELDGTAGEASSSGGKKCSNSKCLKAITRSGPGNYKYCSTQCKNICAVLRNRDRSNSISSQKRQRTESVEYSQMSTEDFINIIKVLEAENIELIKITNCKQRGIKYLSRSVKVLLTGLLKRKKGETECLSRNRKKQHTPGLLNQ